MYALHILSRYEFIKHALRYAKYSKADRLMFRIYDCPKVIKTMTYLMQFLFQCDADLGDNLDNKHSQTNCLGYLASILYAGVVPIKSTLVVKVSSADSNSNLGTKRVSLATFNALTYKLVNRDIISF